MPRGLRVVNPGLGVKLLLAKLREQQPGLRAGSEEVREALTALKAESERGHQATATSAGTEPPADEGGAPAI